MNSDESKAERASTRTASDRPWGRRAFLVGAGAAMTTLAGCSFTAEVGGGESAPEPRTPAATQTAARTPTRTPSAAVGPEPVVLTVEPRPVMVESVTPTEPLRYLLERPYLYVERASDAAFNGPNTEEIYGEITVAASDGTNEVRTTSGNDLLWRADRASAREIGEASGQVLTDAVSPVEFVFPDAAAVDPDDAYIEVTATFREADRGANDDDEFSLFRSDDRWYLDGPTVERGFSTATGESRFVMEYAGNGTLLNFSYNIVAL